MTRMSYFAVIKLKLYSLDVITLLIIIIIYYRL